MAVELYHFWSSVCSVRCRMALEEKGVEWQSRYIDLFKFDQMKPDYLVLNPDGVVPTLVHDGVPIRESTIINEYIDAAFPGMRLVPADPVKAARMREFVRACEDGFIGIVLLTMVKYILPKLRNRWSDAELRAQAEKRPMKFYRDIHGRAVRGEITAEELSDAEATCESLARPPRGDARSGPVDRRRLLARGHHDRALHVPASCPGQGALLVARQPAARARLVRAPQPAPRLRHRGVLARRKRRRL